MWYKIKISANNIETSTDKAVLIRMKHNSNYDGFVFWHPAKLVREDGKMYTFSFNDDFKFNLKKYGQGKWNSREVVREDIIGASAMLAEWEL
jgi:1-acyl-sn-glycerol-3-phosphate acyltransferase